MKTVKGGKEMANVYLVVVDINVLGDVRVDSQQFRLLIFLSQLQHGLALGCQGLHQVVLDLLHLLLDLGGIVARVGLDAEPGQQLGLVHALDSHLGLIQDRLPALSFTLGVLEEVQHRDVSSEDIVPRLDQLVIESLVTELGEPGYLAISQRFLKSLSILLLLILVL